uniref:Poly [ADP-ribose] polymerase n=1 Tax=Amphiprion percula TaxID=161767 RepID=A0A3P8TVS6_AMPPE
MADLSCSSGMKRKLPEGILAEEPSPASSKVTLLGQSFLLLEIPADTNTTLPVWEALRARQVVITWTANPYSISVRLTPMTSEQGETTADVLICDSFLLGVCHAGEGCTMHHTRYPFHWQLHSVITQRWVDVSPRSQVALERIYCNINAENVFLKEGISLLISSQNVSTLLLHAMSEKEPKCYFYIGPVKYMVDFTMMLQINITTRFQRDIRYRPVYRSPESMQPYLQTGIQCDSPQPVGDPPGMNFSVDPLEEFSSWYPPVWRLASEQECSLVDVPVGTQAYQKIRNLVHESMTEAMVDVISIQQVQNVLHWDKYQRQKMYMQKQRTEESEEPLERHLFHGTTKGASEDICHNNFDPRLAGVNGTAYGLGSYFATTALLSSRYSHTEEADEVYHMFLAKVLVGNIALGCTSYRRPPPYRSETRKHRLYDACVDDRYNPTIFVVFDSCQCYPYYLIKYKYPLREIDI